MTKQIRRACAAGLKHTVAAAVIAALPIAAASAGKPVTDDDILNDARTTGVPDPVMRQLPITKAPEIPKLNYTLSPS